MVRSFLPKPGTVKVWLRNSEEGESGDSQWEFEGEEAADDFWCAPLPWDGGKERRNSHGGGGGIFTLLKINCPIVTSLRW